jgi:hypothetical protein
MGADSASCHLFLRILDGNSRQSLLKSVCLGAAYPAGAWEDVREALQLMPKDPTLLFYKAEVRYLIFGE